MRDEDAPKPNSKRSKTSVVSGTLRIVAQSVEDKVCIRICYLDKERTTWYKELPYLEKNKWASGVRLERVQKMLGLRFTFESGYKLITRCLADSNEPLDMDSSIIVSKELLARQEIGHSIIRSKTSIKRNLPGVKEPVNFGTIVDQVTISTSNKIG